MFNKNEKYAYERGYRMDKDGTFYNPKGNIVRGHLDDGYRNFKIRVPGNYKKHYHFRLSRFQAYCKFGDKIYEEGIVVRHLNGIRDDNSWDNIEIGTQSQNMLDRPVEERKKHAIKASRKIAKYDVDEVRKYHNKVNSYKKTMKKFNIPSSGSLWDVLNRPNIYKL